MFLIHDGESLSDIKVRIQKRLQVPDEQFLKVLVQTFHYIIDPGSSMIDADLIILGIVDLLKFT